MTFLLYNTLVTLFLVLYSPIHIIRLIMGSKYRESTLPRLGFQKYPQADKSRKTFLIHSVSVGETQVAGTLATEFKAQDPNCRIFVSTVTETGQAVAAKLKDIDGHLYLPYDLWPFTNKLFKIIQPDAVIVVENDLWLNYLHSAHSRNIPCFLVNGKLSESSLRSYKKFTQFGHLLFDPIKHFFVQSDSYQQRFENMGIKDQDITVCGNIKLDSKIPHLNQDELNNFTQSLGLNHKSLDHCLIFGSTHAEEEELALKVHQEIKIKFPGLQTIIVPRHPERFDKVASILEKSGTPFSRASQITAGAKSDEILLVDQMGVLMKLYQIGSIGIVCGTFTDKVGGHNFLEPAFYEKAFVYGPWTFSQPGFYQLCQQADAGIQCSAEQLATTLETLLQDPQKQALHGQRGKKIIDSAKGAVHHTVEAINNLISE
ncbi:3-deoxy-D-manno-octulosonic acid transferase [Lentisphaera profundi]|uniref:3-deoxy-D-manno-octulosonic acid transferase n=1 Tax=Lentisphaera profundi TaxID=1658616 RepID=A0ABY7VVU7_9BACT|nr:3-deoxy-D-manno-octulosonic acid transferase [Lentisphaera profundi]WDE98361.1 3-deoxy-D-manno-octulosonic acid transferase [Lentisphaera profundi]